VSGAGDGVIDVVDGDGGTGVDAGCAVVDIDEGVTGSYGAVSEGVHDDVDGAESGAVGGDAVVADEVGGLEAGRCDFSVDDVEGAEGNVEADALKAAWVRVSADLTRRVTSRKERR